MSKIASCSIILDGGKEVFRKGDVIKGTVGVRVTENVEIKAVKLFFFGEALAKWSNIYDESIGKESYVNMVMHLFGQKNKSGPTVILPAGRHEYKFTFRCPNDGLPSSFEGKYGAVRYWLKLVIQRPTFRFDRNYSRGITILDDIDVQKPIYQGKLCRVVEKEISKALGIGNVGKLSIRATCDRKAYCPGEQIVLSVFVKNDTLKDMGKLKAKLVQFVKYKASGGVNNINLDIREITGSSIIDKGAERKWENQLIQVPAISPTTTPRSCHIILISYYVKVWVEVPWGSDAFVTLPITIGTLPFNRNTAPVPSTSASNSFEIDASGALCYTKCGYVQRFTESNGNFSNFSYTPMCCYVPNYEFKPTKNAKAAKSDVVEATEDLQIPNKTNVNVTTSQAAASSLPPSYDDVITMDNQRAKAEITKVVDIPKSNNFLLTIRFADIHLTEFRNYIIDHRNDLKSKEGELIALSSQPIAIPSMWPSQTSIAILMFNSAENAVDWFKTSNDITKTDWYKTCEAIVNKSNETYNENKHQFVMHYISMKKTNNVKSLREFYKMVRQNLTPKRIAAGGVTLCNTNLIEILKGDWFDNSLYLHLTQWASIKDYINFKKISLQVKEYEENKSNFFDVEGPMLFQSEELYPYQWQEADTSDYDTEDDKQDGDQPTVVTSDTVHDLENGDSGINSKELHSCEGLGADDSDLSKDDVEEEEKGATVA